MSPPHLALRVANATLRIKLTEDANADLLLDRELVMEHCPTLAPPLRQPGEARYNAAWDKSVLVKAEDSRDEVRISTLALNQVDQTLLLSGSELLETPPATYYTKFCKSVLATPGWGLLVDNWDTTRATSVRLHLVLFKILHGNCLVKFVEDDKYDTSNPLFFHVMPNICALAEYYGCLSFVTSPIIQLLKAHPDLWRSVSRRPLFWLRFAVKLEWKELYLDATRHILAASGGHRDMEEFPGLADHLGMSVKDLKAHVDYLRIGQSETINDLDKSLRRLQLVESHVRHYGVRRPAYLSFVNQLDHEPANRPVHVRSRQTSRFLAGVMFGQWLAAIQVGERIIEGTKRAPLGPQDLNIIVSRLERAAAFHNPAGLSGAQAPKQVLDMFGYGDDAKLVNEVRQCLCDVVREANICIKEAFEAKEDDMNDTMVTYGRANFDVGEGGYFTYLPLDESTFPWEDAEEAEAFWQPAIEKIRLDREKARINIV